MQPRLGHQGNRGTWGSSPGRGNAARVVQTPRSAPSACRLSPARPFQTLRSPAPAQTSPEARGRGLRSAARPAPGPSPAPPTPIPPDPQSPTLSPAPPHLPDPGLPPLSSPPPSPHSHLPVSPTPPHLPHPRARPLAGPARPPAPSRLAALRGPARPSSPASGRPADPAPCVGELQTVVPGAQDPAGPVGTGSGSGWAGARGACIAVMVVLPLLPARSVLVRLHGRCLWIDAGQTPACPALGPAGRPWSRPLGVNRSLPSPVATAELSVGKESEDRREGTSTGPRACGSG